jgi:hypothetical protein
MSANIGIGKGKSRIESLYWFIALFHPRRRHHHRWRNIWDKYRVLLQGHLGLVVLCRLEHRRCQGVQLGRVGLWDLLGRVRHRHRVRRFDRLVLVVRLRRLGRGRRAWLDCLERSGQVLLCLRLCQLGRVVRLVQVGLVVLHLHPCLGRQGCRLVRVHQARRVGRQVLGGPVGMVCMAVG